MIKKTLYLSLLATIIAGCASNQPFTNEQLAVVKEHKAVLKMPTTDKEKALAIYSRGEKAGTEAMGVVFGLMTGSFSYNSGGQTPRDRFNDSSLIETMKSSARKASAETVDIASPTQTIVQLLANEFETVAADKKIEPNQLTIKAEHVAWHLYYDKLIKNDETYFLEYASDISLSLPEKKLYRRFTCDQQSKEALTKTEWLANEQLRIRDFANKTAQTCVDQVLSELGKK